MKFTIVTPSYRQLDYLGCCVGSVADQTGVQVEHIVQDAGSPGIGEFSEKIGKQLREPSGGSRVDNLTSGELLHLRTSRGYSLRIFKEPDSGMYDAINRGMAKATGSILAYLNCDEQYLPGVLRRVAEAFRVCVSADIFFGDVVVLKADGHALCWRKVLVPLVPHTWTCHFSAFSAGMFFRKELFEKGVHFDVSYRAAADATWYLQARRQGARSGALNFITSTFLSHGNNLGLSPLAEEERGRIQKTAPSWMRLGGGIWRIAHRLRRWMCGSLRPRGLEYAVYLSGQKQRTAFHEHRVPGYWPGRWRLP